MKKLLFLTIAVIVTICVIAYDKQLGSSTQQIYTSKISRPQTEQASEPPQNIHLTNEETEKIWAEAELPLAPKGAELPLAPEGQDIQNRMHPSGIPSELQAKRLDMINRLIREGIFDRIEMPGTLPHLWVGPIFMNLDFETKSSFVEVVYAYYFDRPGRKQSQIWGDSVILKDIYTGKEIGSYSLSNWGSPLNLK